jgi:signal transduction histidine kinase
LKINYAASQFRANLMGFLTTNQFALTLLISSTIVLTIAIYISRLLEESVKWISYIMISLSLWGFFYGIEITQDNLQTIIFLTRIQYLGIIMAPTAWVLFSLKYTGFQHRSKKWIYSSLIFLSLLIYLVVLTNSLHHLHYKSTWIFSSGNFELLGFEKGPWYKVVVVYCYVLYFLGTFFLLQRFRFANKHFKFQTWLLIVGGFFPILINIFYQFSLFVPLEGIDATPAAFLFSYLFIGISVLRFNLLNLKPIARNKILEAMSKGVLVFDHRNKLVDFNLASKNFSRHPDKIKIGQRADLIFQDRLDILKLLNSSNPEILESRIRENGRLQIQKIEFIPILEANPAISGVMLLFDDITEEVKTKEQLQHQAYELGQLNNLKDKLFGIISHDLKGPVFGVREFIHLTHTGMISRDEFMEMLPEVSKNLEHVTILIDNLLAWTSTQLRGELLFQQKINLGNLIEHQVNILERIALAKSIHIEVRELENFWIQADKNMLEIVFRNLLSNAIKFSKPYQKIEVYGEKTESHYLVCIRDFGSGIPEENLKKLREGESFSTKGSNNEGGTGLGMILVREFLQKNKGNLQIQSNPGKGSEFWVEFPITTEE